MAPVAQLLTIETEPPSVKWTVRTYPPGVCVEIVVPGRAATIERVTIQYMRHEGRLPS